MKQVIMRLFPFFFLIIFSLSVQSQVWKKIKRQLEDRTAQKVGNTADKVLDKAEDAAIGTENNNGTTANGDNSGNGQKHKALSNDEVFSIESKFDFVPGEKIIAFQDFSAVALGDFPENWNTNSKGEVVKIKGRPEKWLYVNTKGGYMPTLSNNLPDNFTFEFDLASSNDVIKTEGFSVGFARLENKKSFDDWQTNPEVSGIGIGFMPGKTWYSMKDIRYAGVRGEKEMQTDEFFPINNLNFVHISIKVQKERLRVYMNQQKVWDLPKAFVEIGKINSIIFNSYEPRAANDGYFITNLKWAAGDPDTRNKLITAGKFVTSGILFKVNSSVEIKPESAGVIKEIANVLTEDQSVKIKIVGHTDSDGDASTNIELSKQRAIAVKNLLAQAYGIDASRMITDGLGASQPVADNKTPEGKEQNRRVEFIKL